MSGSWAAPRLLELGLQLEPREGVGPHRLEQLGNRSEGLAPRAVVAMPAFRPHRHQPGIRERAQLERDRPERHGLLDVRGGRLGAPKRS